LSINKIIQSGSESVDPQQRKSEKINYKILDIPGIINDAGFSGYTSDLLLRKPLSPPATQCHYWYTTAHVLTSII